MIKIDPRAAREIQSELLSGESIYWAGMPNPHIIFHSEDWQMIPFSLLWGGFACELRERLLEACSMEQRFDVLEAALLRRIDPPDPHPAVEFALRAFAAPMRRTITGGTEETGLSARRFIELFRA